MPDSVYCIGSLNPDAIEQSRNNVANMECNAVIGRNNVANSEGSAVIATKPTITVNKPDLERLSGQTYSIEDLSIALETAKAEIDAEEEPKAEETADEESADEESADEESASEEAPAAEEEKKEDESVSEAPKDEL